MIRSLVFGYAELTAGQIILTALYDVDLSTSSPHVQRHVLGKLAANNVNEPIPTHRTSGGWRFGDGGAGTELPLFRPQVSIIVIKQMIHSCNVRVSGSETRRCLDGQREREQHFQRTPTKFTGDSSCRLETRLSEYVRWNKYLSQHQKV